MFTIDNTITELNIREKNILKLLFSMNIHQVATPEMILEEAKSYILFFRESAGMVSAHIALYLTVTDRRLFFVHSSNPFAEREMDAIEQEALEFAEGLGAMLDEKDFAKMTMEDKGAWIDAQEIFNPKAEPVAAPASPPALETLEATPSAPVQAEPTPPPASPVQEVSKEPITIPPEVQSAPAAPAPVPAELTPPPAPTVQEAPKEPVVTPPAVQAATPVQPTQPAQQAPAEPDPQGQPASTPAPAEDAEPVGPSEPSDLHEQKIQNRKTAAVSRYTVSSAEAARKRQEILRNAVKEGIAKPPKQPLSGPAASSTGVVSRDREALARLLTSF